MKIVELDNIHFRRSGKPILRGVSWTIEAGERWAFIGANGSGKTTLLKILTGYEWPTSGSVTVLGKRYGEVDLRELRKTIGWVSTALAQKVPGKDTALEITASGFDASLGVYRKLDDAHWTRARESLDLVGGSAFAGQSYETLSQGEQQRTLIARSLTNRPAVLVLDEPCAGLDPASRRAFLEDLGKLAVSQEAPTVIFVTHHIEEIGPWITDVHVIRGGETLASGAVEKVLTSKTVSRAVAMNAIVKKIGGHYSLSPDQT